jgi:hypothetical protein
MNIFRRNFFFQGEQQAQSIELKDVCRFLQDAVATHLTYRFLDSHSSAQPTYPDLMNRAASFGSTRKAFKVQSSQMLKVRALERSYPTANSYIVLVLKIMVFNW